MSTFLDDLERELLAAHPRRGAARRRVAAGRALRAAPIALLLVGAATFVFAVGNDSASGPATKAPPAPAPEPVFTERDPTLPEKALAVLNGSGRPGLGHDVDSFLAALDRRADALGRFAGGVHPSTRVHYSPERREQGRRLAARLGVPAVSLQAGVRNASRAADFVLELGTDVHSAGLEPFYSVSGRRTPGVAGVLRLADSEVVAIRAGPLPAKGFYAVWFTGGGEKPVLLGFAPPPKRGVLEAADRTEASSVGRQIVVSVERTENPKAPTRTVLVADAP